MYRQTDSSRPEPTHLDELKRLPRPLYGHRETLPNRAIPHRHRHPWAQLSYAARGVVEVATPEARFIAPPDRAVWIPPGRLHGVHCSRNSEIRSLYLDPVACDLEWPDSHVLEVQPLLRELIRAFGELPVLYDKESADSRLTQVLLDRLRAAPRVPLMLPWPSEPGLIRLCERIQAHPDAPHRLSEHASQLGVAERTLSRAFRAQTGLGFRRWRQRCRLFAALPRLEAGERVTDVALACGYESLSAFIAAFRKEFGRTPGELVHRTPQ